MSLKKVDLYPWAMNELWLVYAPICTDVNKFNQQFIDSPITCIWEMVVAKKFADNGWLLEKAIGEGQPDFFATYGQERIAVECTSVTAGTDQNPPMQAMRNLPAGFSNGPNRDLIALRYSSAFITKSEKHKSFVCKSEVPYLVAIHANFYDEFDPVALAHKSSIRRVLYGIGETAMSFPIPLSGQIFSGEANIIAPSKDSVPTKSSVKMGMFHLCAHSHVSAVLFSDLDMCNWVFSSNGKAVRKIDCDSMSFIEYRYDGDGTFALQSCAPPSSPPA